MKKIYMKPELELIKLETQRMMTASTETISVNSVQTTSTGLSKDASSDMWHWMDDEQK